MPTPEISKAELTCLKALLSHLLPCRLLRALFPWISNLGLGCCSGVLLVVFKNMFYTKNHKITFSSMQIIMRDCLGIFSSVRSCCL